MKPFTLDAAGVSTQNKYEIIKYFLSDGTHSRSEAARSVSKSAMTVGKVASAMLARGLLVSELAAGEIGRSTEYLLANPSLCAYLINVGKESFSLSLLRANRTETRLRSRPRNPSLSYEDDLRSFLLSISGKLSQSTQDDVMGVALIYSDSVEYAPPCLDIRPDVTASQTEATGAYLQQLCPNGCSLWVNISDRILPTLYVGARPISNGAMGLALRSKSETEIARELAKYLDSLCDTVIPDKVLITADVFPVDEIFIGCVKENMKRKDSISFEVNKDMSPISAYALDTATDSFAKRLAGVCQSE